MFTSVYDKVRMSIDQHSDSEKNTGPGVTQNEFISQLCHLLAAA